MSEIKFTADQFHSLIDGVLKEHDGRMQNAKNGTLSFGVHFLDLALGGIFKNDIVLIGAKTGLGKTALATHIAQANALRGKRVHYFALEAEEYELERRIKYNYLAEAIRAGGYTDLYRSLNFLDWYMGRLDDYTKELEKAVDETISKRLKTMHTFYRGTDFTADQFEQMVVAIQDQTDLIILDHLHYVDSPDENENRGYKQIVKKIRDVSLDIGKPVIVVAHVRKGDRRSGQLIPNIEDFHGSSDVPKIATKAIMIAPAYEQEKAETYLWPTYIAPLKCRFDGQRIKHVGLVNFNARVGTYAREFEIGDIRSEKFEILDNVKVPEWAKAKGVPL